MNEAFQAAEVTESISKPPPMIHSSDSSFCVRRSVASYQRMQLLHSVRQDSGELAA